MNWFCIRARYISSNFILHEIEASYEKNIVYVFYLVSNFKYIC